MGNFDDYLLGQSIAFMQKHSQYGMSPLQSIKTLEMGDENMEKIEFKVGDKIRIVNSFVPYLNGKTAIITEIENNCTDGRPYCPYCVRLIHRPTETIWLGSYEMELVREEKEMKLFELLLNHWGVEVEEKFNIDNGNYGPYHFNKEGRLIDRDGDDADSSYINLILGKSKIKKIEAKEMTVAEIEKELGYAIKVVKEKK